MNDIFDSEEFLSLEKLCNAKKVSFVLAVTKFSSVNKPKKGPVYVMSDFFVYDIPEDWERQSIRSTPQSTWLNPKAPPPLSHPLSQLLNLPSEIKQNFIELWNHIHGVMAENYFCPKLYLTRVPRAEVERYMDPSLLPPGSHLSCCDLVYFPVFVAWLKSPTTVDKMNGHTRVRFVALLIHLAYQLYQLNPETHVQGRRETDADIVTNNVDISGEVTEKEEIEILTPSKLKPKTPEKPILIEEDIEILTPLKPPPEMSCSSTQTPSPTRPKSSQDKRPPMVSIASDLVQALDEIEILTPKKDSVETVLSNESQKSAVKVSSRLSHDSNSLDEVTEIEILTPLKKKTEPEFDPIDYIDLVTTEEDSIEFKVKELVNNPIKTSSSMLFTKSSNPATSTSSLTEKNVEENKPRCRPTLQFRKDLWGKQAEIVDITDDISCDESVNTSTESDSGCSRTNPVKLKSREELKSMWGKDEDEASPNIKSREELKAMLWGKDDDSSEKKSKDSSKEKDSNTSDVKTKSTEQKTTKSNGKDGDKIAEKDNKENNYEDNKGVENGNNDTTKNKDEIDKKSSGIIKAAEQKKDVQVVEAKKRSVSDSLGKLIQVCIKLLPKKEFNTFTRKVSKYLNNLHEEHSANLDLVKFIDKKCTVIKYDPKNKYVHMNEVFIEMKKFKQSDIASETSENSNTDQKNLAVGPVAKRLDDKENIPEKNNDHVPKDTSNNDAVQMEVDLTSDPDNDKPVDGFSKKESQVSHEEAIKNLSLKEVLQSFLEKCRKNLAAKVFQPYFKQILKYMNNLDPAHLNSLPLKVFVLKHSEKDTSQDIIALIDAVISEIQKYQKSNKRALPSDDVPQIPPKKKVCLTTIANKVPVKPSQEPILKQSSTEVVTNIKSTNVNATNVNVAEVKDTIGDKSESVLVCEEVKNTYDDTTVESEVRFPPSDIFQSLGLRPKNKPEPETNLGVEIESKSSLEGEQSNSEDVADKPSSSKQCFNENLVHEKDKKKAKKKVSPAHIIKLEKALKKCAKEIQRLEEAEVDWDEDNDSNYILCAKYKRRYMDLFKKIADYKELSSSLDRKKEKKFFCNESRYPEINKKIQKFVNRTKEFPDFQDIKRLVKDANTSLHLNTLQMHDEAENIFQSVGRKLKKRREIDDTDVMVSYLKENQMEDPAAKNQELDNVLIVQAAEGKKNISKYFDDFYKTHVVNAKSSSEVDTEEAKKTQEPEGSNTVDTVEAAMKDDVPEEQKAVEKEKISSEENKDKKEVGTEDVLSGSKVDKEGIKPGVLEVNNGEAALTENLISSDAAAIEQPKSTETVSEEGSKEVQANEGIGINDNQVSMNGREGSTEDVTNKTLVTDC